MADEWAELIRQLIQVIADGNGNSYPWEQNIAQQYNLLPLYGDMGGYLALRSDLEIITIPDDPRESLHVETDELWRNVALVCGSKRFPQLAELIPKRPSDAHTCPSCDGTGIFTLPEMPEIINLGCKCGGLGWLPKA
jgi:hypothetical protein